MKSPERPKIGEDHPGASGKSQREGRAAGPKAPNCPANGGHKHEVRLQAREAAQPPKGNTIHAAGPLPTAEQSPIESQMTTSPGDFSPSLDLRLTARPDVTLATQDKILERLGLSSLSHAPSDPKQLAKYLVRTDRADAAADLDEFSRRIRRAVRIRIAFDLKLHRAEGMTWKAWVSKRFASGYKTYQRSNKTAELQVELLAHGLPLLTNENQARALCPFMGHEGFWAAMAEGPYAGGYPTANELKAYMQLKLDPSPGKALPDERTLLRLRLESIERSITAPAGDEVVKLALGLVARAVAVLSGKVRPRVRGRATDGAHARPKAMPQPDDEKQGKLF
jgi:hypothetical protein